MDGYWWDDQQDDRSAWWVKGVYTVRTFSPFSTQPTGPFWKNPPWDPLSKAVPFPSLCLIHGLYHDLKLSFSYSGLLVYWVPYPKLLHDDENLGPFLPASCSQVCNTVPDGHRHSTFIGCINKEFRQTLEILCIQFQTRPPQKSKYSDKVNHMSFPAHMKVMFTLYCSPLSVQ